MRKCCVENSVEVNPVPGTVLRLLVSKSNNVSFTFYLQSSFIFPREIHTIAYMKNKHRPKKGPLPRKPRSTQQP